MKVNYCYLNNCWSVRLLCDSSRLFDSDTASRAASDVRVRCYRNPECRVCVPWKWQIYKLTHGHDTFSIYWNTYGHRKSPNALIILEKILTSHWQKTTNGKTGSRPNSREGNKVRSTRVSRIPGFPGLNPNTYSLSRKPPKQKFGKLDFLFLLICSNMQIV